MLTVDGTIYTIGKPENFQFQTLRWLEVGLRSAKALISKETFLQDGNKWSGSVTISHTLTPFSRPTGEDTFDYHLESMGLKMMQRRVYFQPPLPKKLYWVDF